MQPNGWQSPAEGGSGDYVFIDAPATGTSAQGTVTVSGRAGNSSTDPNGGGGGGGGETLAQQPQVVIAMIDTGGNPYHVDFRDEGRLVHPSTYLTGFPADAKAVPLCFIDGSNGAFSYKDDCKSSWQANVADDDPATGSIEEGDLVWYPGTRLLGKSFAHEDANSPVGFDQGPDTDPLTGDSGTSHGSWVSSTAVGNKFGTCPDCMLIVLEADTVDAIDAAYAWAAQQPWIDVITSSTSVGVIGLGINAGGVPLVSFTGKHDAAVTGSQNGKIFLTSSGNGAGNLGLVPTSTFLLDSGSPALIPVGASDDAGLATHWSDFPAEIMGNGNSRQVADTASMKGETSVGGTSFSSPGAAGVLADSLLKARIACNDTEEGASAAAGGALTLLRNNGCAVNDGPFANGILTRDELHEAFVKNAIPPYDQLSPIPGPVTWAKNAYGYVDLGDGLGNGGSTIQPLVTESILGTRTIPVRVLEQFWYDDVVREIQARQWGPRPVADGDVDAYPRADGACMPQCAPDELQRYADGFFGMGASSTYQDLFDILGVSAEEFARAAPTGFGGVYEPRPNVAGLLAETGDLVVTNDESFLTVRLKLAGALDGVVPTVRDNPVTYEVTFSANHNGVNQDYRLSYTWEAVDVLALLDGTISEPLTDKFGIFVDTAPNEQGTSWICPIETDLSGSHVDPDTFEAVWVVPLTAFDQDNRPVEATATCAFTRGGRALQAGDTLKDITGSAVLTVGIVNFGNGLGLFGESTADDYTLGGQQEPPATVAVTVNGQAAGTATPSNGQWSLDVDFSQYTPVDGSYVVAATFGTATDSVTLQAGPTELSVTLAAQCETSACDEGTTYEVSATDPLTVTFSALAAGGSGNGRQYTFYFGDGTQAGPQDASTIQHDYAYANPSGYVTKVVVTEDNATVGATSQEIVIKTTSTVTVDPQPVPTEAALTVTPGSGAAPLTVTADAGATQHATGTDATEYEFDFGDGTVVTGSSATATHVYTQPRATPYTVTVTVTDSDGDGTVIGTSSATAMVAVGTGNELTALLSVSPSTVLVGEIVTFDGCASFAADGRSIVQYAFDPDGPDRPLEPVAQDVTDPVSCVDGHNDASVYRHAYATPGQYQPTLAVTDDMGVTKYARASVKVTPPQAVRNGRNGGGALGWALLLPMLGASLIRRRKIRLG